MVYFSSVECFKQHNVYGVPPEADQSSGVRIQMTDYRGQKQRVADMVPQVPNFQSVFCRLTSVSFS